MNVTFNIVYRTSFGEALVLHIVSASGHAGATRHAMASADGSVWTCSVRMAARTSTHIDYFYTVERSGREWRREWTAVPHRLEFAGSRAATYTTHDQWRDLPGDSIYLTSAFIDAVWHRSTAASEPSAIAKLLRLKVLAPGLQGHERLAITGAHPALGAWQQPASVPMVEHTPGEWVASIDATPLEGSEVEFKFVIVNEGSAAIAHWEQGDNRRLYVPHMPAGDVVAHELAPARFERAPWRGAGTVVPVFALRSEGSCGVGDFGDLGMMVDWVAHTGQHVLQVLPINDTTDSHRWTDSYPYNCISVMALHPMYADLRQLPPLRSAERREHYERLRQEVNALPQMDYERVNEVKGAWLRELFAEQWPAVARRASFKEFFANNSEWLVPYAAFCLHRDEYGTANFMAWPKHQSPDAQELSAMATPGSKAYRAAAYWYYVQYTLYQQMTAAHSHARQRRVILKGDIPIGVSRNSVEVWTKPQLFNLNGQTGAPPDAFSTWGQNWGFPTYRWDAMMADGCRWWTSRLKKMAELFEAYRIDHILGFFRIWEIPTHAVHGLQGHFSPSLPMTEQEVAAYGFRLDAEAMTRPHITDRALQERFGDRADEVRQKYLAPAPGGQGYTLLPAYDTERKVQAAFANDTEAHDGALRDGLYLLISDMLFLRDTTDPSRLHPRIAAQSTMAYAELSDEQKAAFNRLYDDYYYRRHNQFWYNEAMRRLPPMALASPMLICAEDLGMVPQCVAWAMDRLHILSLEIQSMPKEYGVAFGRLQGYPYRSVCTITTHDTPTLRQWWDEDQKRTQAYYNTMLHRSGQAPHPLPAWLAEDIVARHLLCPSALCIITLQDWLATSERLRLPDANAERINIPAQPRHYWRYRMHITLEQLMGDTEFANNIRSLIEEGGRLHNKTHHGA